MRTSKYISITDINQSDRKKLWEKLQNLTFFCVAHVPSVRDSGAPPWEAVTLSQLKPVKQRETTDRTAKTYLHLWCFGVNATEISQMGALPSVP